MTRATKRVIFINRKVAEADTFHTCVCHYPLHKLLFFGFGQVRTMVAVATFSLLSLYLANSQVSIYRTIGTLVLKLHSNSYEKKEIKGFTETCLLEIVKCQNSKDCTSMVCCLHTRSRGVARRTDNVCIL